MSIAEEIRLQMPSIFGIGSDYLIDGSISGNQFGGSFSFTFANEGVTPPAQRSVATVLDFKAIVDDVTYGRGSSGDVFSVNGRLTLQTMLNARPFTYLNSDPWEIDNEPAPHLNKTKEFEKNPQYKLIPGLTAGELIRQICNDNSVAVVFGNGFVDYKVYEYVVSSGRTVIEIIQELALHGNANAVYNHETGEIEVFGSQATGQEEKIDFDDILSDFNNTRIRSEFDSLVIESSSQMTQYNSFYGGKPVKLNGISFNAGSLALKDLSLGSSTSRPSPDWYFPVEQVTTNPDDAFESEDDDSGSAGVNLWAEITRESQIDSVTKKAFANTIMVNSRIESCWDYLSYSSNQVRWRDYYRAYASSSSDPVDIEDFTEQSDRFLALLRWTNAYTFVNFGQDVHPQIYVLPSDAAPEELEKEDYAQEDLSAEIALTVGDQLPATFNKESYPSATDVPFPVPEEIKGTSPNGIGFTVEFDRQGTAKLGLVFTERRGDKVYPTNPRQAPFIKVTDGYYTEAFGEAEFEKDQSVIDVESTEFEDLDVDEETLAQHLRKVVERTGARIIVPGELGTKIPLTGPSIKPTGNISTGGGEEGEGEEGEDPWEGYNFEDEVMANAYEIDGISEVYDEGGALQPTKARITLFRRVLRDFPPGPYSFVCAFQNDINYGSIKTSADGVYLPFVDSGLVQENTDSIQGSWSIYGVPRIVTPRTIIKSEHLSAENYKGLDAENDGSFQERIAELKQPKVITANLCTDFMGNPCHMTRLADYLWGKTKETFNSYNVNFIARDLKVPEIGTTIDVDGIKSTLIGWQISFSGRSVTKTYTCGRLPTL